MSFQLSARGQVTTLSLLMALLLNLSNEHLVQAHEGHAALPSKGATIDRDQLLLSAPAREALGVETAKIVLQRLQRRLRVNARVILPARQHALVTTLVPGKIDEVLAKPGDQVVAGQVLCRIESLEFESLQLDFLQAATALDLAKKVLIEREVASQKGAVPERMLLEARTEVEQQTAHYAIAARKLQALGIERNALEELHSEVEPLKAFSVRSPRDGVVMEADVRAGQAVQTTDHLFHIVDRTRLEVIGDVLETDAALVHVGTSVRMGFVGLADQRFSGTVQSLELKVDAQRHIAGAVVEIDNSELLLRPGLFGRMEIDVRQSEDVIACPPEALIDSRGSTYVLLQRGEGKYLRRPVTAGLRTPQGVEIVKGLFPGDQVVVVGTQTLNSLFGQGSSPTTKNRQAPNSPSTMPSDGAHDSNGILVTQAAIEIPTAQKTFAMPLLEGKLGSLQITANESVEAGQILAELDSQQFRSMQLEYLQARARRNWLESLIPRLEKLAEQGFAPRVRFLELQAELKSLHDNVSSLERKFVVLGFSEDKLNRLRSDTLSEQLADDGPTLRLPIRAPAAGRIARFQVVPGQVVSAETVLFEIQDLHTVWVRGFVFERDLVRIAPGQSTKVTFPAQPGLELSGKVVRISPALHEKSRVLPVWIEIPNPEGTLREGMLARAVIQALPPKAAVGANN